MPAVLYVTAPSEEEAKRMARELIGKKLVACANIFPISSLYRWKGELQEEREVAMILKTSAERVEEVIRELRRIHPHELPCILSLSVSGGLPEFLCWVEEETQPS
jgi:periplasmic divalent cation tolerance protein